MFCFLCSVSYFIQVLKNGDLIIKNISWAKHVGLYRCEALNVFGKDATEVFLYPVSVTSIFGLENGLRSIMAFSDYH